MSRAELLLWVVLPYVALTVFVAGHVWRYRTDQLGWTTRSTQLLERRRLRPAVLLFHLGLFAVIGGHVLGILVPASVTEAAGLSEDALTGLTGLTGLPPRRLGLILCLRLLLLLIAPLKRLHRRAESILRLDGKPRRDLRLLLRARQRESEPTNHHRRRRQQDRECQSGIHDAGAPPQTPGGGPPTADWEMCEMRRGATAAAVVEPNEMSASPLEHSLRSRSGLASLAGCTQCIPLFSFDPFLGVPAFGTSRGPGLFIKKILIGCCSRGSLLGRVARWRRSGCSLRAAASTPRGRCRGSTCRSH